MMIKNDYEIMSELDGVFMYKKDTKYKIQFKTKLNQIEKTVEILKKNKFFELNYLLNKDIIEKYESTNIKSSEFKIYYLFSLIDDDEYEEYDKYYIKLSNIAKFEESKTKYAYLIESTNDNEINNNETNDFMNNSNSDIHVKLDNLRILIQIDKINNELQFELKFNYTDKKIVAYIKKTVGLFFNKSLCRLKKYFQE